MSESVAELNTRVTRLIEHVRDTSAYLSFVEESLARRLPPGSDERLVAERGAVISARDAGDDVRADALEREFGIRHPVRGGGERLKMLWVSVAVQDERGWVLCAERRGELDRGLIGIPGGKVRAGESVVEAAVRELVEETGLELHAPEAVAVVDVDPRGTTFFVSGGWSGEVRDLEPDKHAPWRFVGVAELRKNLDRLQPGLRSWLDGGGWRIGR